jgi:hypothetical protein
MYERCGKYILLRLQGIESGLLIRPTRSLVTTLTELSRPLHLRILIKSFETFHVFPMRPNEYSNVL